MLININVNEICIKKYDKNLDETKLIGKMNTTVKLENLGCITANQRSHITTVSTLTRAHLSVWVK
jgi:hypothetical protein